MASIKSAVILAAGMSTRLRGVFEGKPKGFLPLAGKPIVERSIELLQAAGIQQILIVTGHLAGQYEALAARYEGVQTVHNPDYADSGSFYSLYCARAQLPAPFLLLESDLVYEARALQTLLDSPLDNAILISGFTQSGDEVYVSGDRDSQQITGIAKDRRKLGEPVGELVGIAKISTALWDAMLAYAEGCFRQHLHLDYEEDALHTLAGEHKVFFCKVDDLLWAEIDDAAHLQRTQTRIFPQIQARETRATAAGRENDVG